MPTENNKFKRSRDRSRSSKANLHDKENIQIETTNSNIVKDKEVREVSKDLPPIKKNSKNTKVNEIKDIDLN